MKRDNHLVRAILRKIHGRKKRERVEIAGYRDDLVQRHLALLQQGGFIEAEHELTWRGHELADALAHEHVWVEMSERFSRDELDGMPVGVFEEIMMEMIAQWARKKADL